MKRENIGLVYGFAIMYKAWEQLLFLTDQSRFGALGHGIHDVDTSVLMSIAEGNVYRTSIRDITKGQSGSPGSMEGMIIYNNYSILGTIDKNTEAGIMGNRQN